MRRVRFPRKKYLCFIRVRRKFPHVCGGICNTVSTISSRCVKSIFNGWERVWKPAKKSIARYILLSLITKKTVSTRKNSQVDFLSECASQKLQRCPTQWIRFAMAISFLSRKDEDDNLDYDARKVHFRGSSICTGGHYAECIVYGSTLADATFILIRLSSASSTAAWNNRK